LTESGPVCSTREAADRLGVSPGTVQLCSDAGLLRALKASRAIGELEIIAVAALTEHTIAERGGLPAGVTVLYKPLRFAELRQRLDPLIEHWQRAAVG
jgi:hypothetical protein